MARQFFVNGECLVRVKGRTDSDIATITELGLSESPIAITLDFKHKDITLDAWGEEPADTQFMLASANIRIPLIHFDQEVLRTCILLSMGGGPGEGSLARAGQLMGNGLPRFSARQGTPGTGYNGGNNYIGLNFTSPVYGLPWRFFYSYLTGPPVEWPLGAERTVTVTNWRAIPFTTDPYGGGLGAYGTYLYDHGTDD